MSHVFEVTKVVVGYPQITPTDQKKVRIVIMSNVVRLHFGLVDLPMIGIVGKITRLQAEVILAN